MPIKTFSPDGLTTLFDSDAITTGICVGVYYIAANTSFTKSFPLLAGVTLRVTDTFGLVLGNSGATDPYYSSVSISYSPPTVTVTPITYNRNILIWSTGTITITSGAGIQAVSSAGTVALSPQGRGLTYLGKATYISTTPTVLTTPQSLGYKTVQITSPPGSQIIGIVDMTTGSPWIQQMPYFVYSGTNTWTADVQATTTSATVFTVTLAAPDIHCFAIPVAPGSGPQCAIYDDDGTLAYDLLAGKLLTSTGRVTFTSTVDTATVPSLTKLGLLGYSNLSSWTYSKFSTLERYQFGAWNLSGTTLSRVLNYGYIEDSGIPAGSNYYSEYRGIAAVEVIDLTGF